MPYDFLKFNPTPQSNFFNYNPQQPQIPLKPYQNPNAGQNQIVATENNLQSLLTYQPQRTYGKTWAENSPYGDTITHYPDGGIVAGATENAEQPATEQTPPQPTNPVETQPVTPAETNQQANTQQPSTQSPQQTAPAEQATPTEQSTPSDSR